MNLLTSLQLDKAMCAWLVLMASQWVCTLNDEHTVNTLVAKTHLWQNKSKHGLFVCPRVDVLDCLWASGVSDPHVTHSVGI